MLALIITGALAIGVGMLLLTVFHAMPNDHSTAKTINAGLALVLSLLVGGVMALLAIRAK